MAVGPRKKLKRKVEEYLRNQRVLSYPFEYSCSQKGMSRRRLLATPGGCVLDDWYVDGDSRGPRPLALARYEMYETWLRQYSSTSYALVLDTRDTFFQRDPCFFQCFYSLSAPSPDPPGRAVATEDASGASGLHRHGAQPIAGYLAVGLRSRWRPRGVGH